MKIDRIYRTLIFLACLSALVVGCDPEHRRKCEWTLMPEPNDAARQDPGYFAVCARNFVTMRQQCNLQIEEKKARELYKKYFRLVDMEVSTEGKFPRKILSIELCER